MRDLEDDLDLAMPTASLSEAASTIKSEWRDKRFRAICQQCGRVVYASDSEQQARRKAREHERTMAKYAKKEGELADAMNPLGGGHQVVVRDKRL